MHLKTDDIEANTAARHTHSNKAILDAVTAAFTTILKAKLDGIPADADKTPALAAVAISGSYNDLSNKPSIPAAQVQTDWDAASGIASIANKPTTFPPSPHNHADATTTVAGFMSAADKVKLICSRLSKTFNRNLVDDRNLGANPKLVENHRSRRTGGIFVSGGWICRRSP